jgi:hypothetical protein
MEATRFSSRHLSSLLCRIVSVFAEEERRTSYVE